MTYFFYYLIQFISLSDRNIICGHTQFLYTKLLTEINKLLKIFFLQNIKLTSRVRLHSFPLVCALNWWNLAFKIFGDVFRDSSPSSSVTCTAKMEGTSWDARLLSYLICVFLWQFCIVIYIRFLNGSDYANWKSKILFRFNLKLVQKSTHFNPIF